MFREYFKNLVLGANTEDLPSVSPFLDWFQGEAGSVVIIALIVTCGIFAFKRDLTKGIMALVGCALFYVFLKNPEGTIIAWMEGLTDLFSGD